MLVANVETEISKELLEPQRDGPLRTILPSGLLLEQHDNILRIILPPSRPPEPYVQKAREPFSGSESPIPAI